ncbi:hypothetical protein JCM5350_002152 [Sporobolomyces pararoseus]
MTKVEKVCLKNSIGGVPNSCSGGPFENSTALDSFREEREKEREIRKRKLELAKARRKRYSESITRKVVSSQLVPSSNRLSFVQSKFISSTSTPTVSSSFLKPTSKRLTASSSTVTPAPFSEIPRFAIPTASSSSRLVPSSSIRSNLVSSTLTRTLSSLAIISTSSSSPKTKKGEPGTSSLSAKPPTLARSKLNASLLSPPLSRQVSARVANPALLAAARSPPVSTSTSTSNEQSIIEKLTSLPSAPTTPFSNLSNNTVKSKGTATTQGRKLVSSTTKKARSGKSQLTTTTKIEGLETKARKIRAVRRRGPSSGK